MLFYASDKSMDPHADQPVLQAGAPLNKARLAVVMLHGRGATAEDILALGMDLKLPDISYLAPQAFGRTWYPDRFLVETRLNEPFLSSALNKISTVINLLNQSGIPAERTALVGFSQGACLSLEYAARYPRRYAAVAGLSGGLIGADHEPRQINGSLAGTPVFLGCSDIDPHIPRVRVDHAAQVIESLGGQVTKHIYPNLGHTVNLDELEVLRALLKA